jgi:hypothetical protein
LPAAEIEDRAGRRHVDEAARRLLSKAQSDIVPVLSTGTHTAATRQDTCHPRFPFLGSDQMIWVEWERPATAQQPQKQVPPRLPLARNLLPAGIFRLVTGITELTANRHTN